MPKWTKKEERMFEEIEDKARSAGKTAAQAREVAARTVNKYRRKLGRTANKITQGTGSPHSRLEDRTVEELRNRAKELKIDGRSSMRKAELIEAIRARN